MFGFLSSFVSIGFKYFVTFVDDFSCVTWLYLMKSRSDLFLVHFVLKFKHNSMSLFTLRSDNAKEYFSEPFQFLMFKHEILHHASCVDTPSQNGVAERKNRHLLKAGRALFVSYE